MLISSAESSVTVVRARLALRWWAMSLARTVVGRALADAAQLHQRPAVAYEEQCRMAFIMGGR
jgi:hypothetical protein